jgi:D-alanine-D-alanine ligase-like ATP-grasp enzyme
MRIAILTPPKPKAARTHIDKFEEAEEIDAALHRLGHDTIAVTWLGANDKTRKALEKAGPDIVFNLASVGDGDRVVTAFLDTMRTPYTGAHTQALEALSDKLHVKTTLAEGDLPVADASLEGPTFSVGILETALGPKVLPPSPDPDAALLADLQRLALAAWRIFALTGYARVDFRVDPDDHPFIVEINPNPSLLARAGFCAAAIKAGMSQSDVVSHLLAAAQN